MGLFTTSEPNQEAIMPNTAIIDENTTLPNIEEPIQQEESLYILIPLGVFLSIIILSLLVCFMASNRRRLVHMYCERRQGRRFLHEDDEYDSPFEPENELNEDELNDEDNPAESLLRGKLQISNSFENYLSTSKLVRSSELFT